MSLSACIASIRLLAHFATSQVRRPRATQSRRGFHFLTICLLLTTACCGQNRNDVGPSPALRDPAIEEWQGFEFVTDAKSSQQEDSAQDKDAKANGAKEKSPQDKDAKAEEQKKDKCDDEKKKEELKKAVAGAYKGVFYDNDFSYLLDECYRGWELGDRLKRLGNSSEGFLDIGGQYRFRMQDEHNVRGLGLTGVDDSFLLNRTRLFANWQMSSKYRVYAEFRDAVSNNEEFPPRAIEENRADMLNLFLDTVWFDDDLGKLTLRSGRQEMLFGEERMISPLDWSNTRRTFEGVDFLWRTKKYALDGFWVRPLKNLLTEYDSPDWGQQLFGFYSTYTADNQNKLDTFYLGYQDAESGLRVDSLGGRYLDNQGDWLFELWGDVQFGTNIDNSDHRAGAWTMGVGRKLSGSWTPTLWVYYDWASGGRVLGGSQGHFQFFPLSHKYLGFIDFFARNNIEAPNVLLTFNPTDKLQILIWYYYFMLETTRDTPYNVNNTPFAPTVAPGSPSLGNEIDLLATYSLTPRATILGGYSRFFSGAYYDTPGLPYSGDGDFFYLQYQLNF